MSSRVEAIGESRKQLAVQREELLAKERQNDQGTAEIRQAMDAMEASDKKPKDWEQVKARLLSMLDSTF